MRFFLSALALCLSAAAALGDEVACITNIDSKREILVYDDEEPNISSNISTREKAMGGPPGIECPGIVTLREILRRKNPSFSYAEAQIFCLDYDESLGTYIGASPGDRDYKGLCEGPPTVFCQYVNESKDAAIAVAGLASGVVAGTNGAATAAGVTAVAHSSGGLILTGPAGYLAGTFGTAGATALATLTAPLAVTGAVITVVAVGGTVYFCSE